MTIYFKLTFFILISICFSLSFHGQDTDQEWIVHFGGKQSDGGRSVSSDLNGNVYITGYFRGNASFGEIELSSKGDTDVFLTKLDKEGKLKWVQQFGSIAYKNLVLTEIGNSVCTDDAGNVYIAGIFSLSANFGDTILNSLGGDDIFVAKLNSTGTVVWARNYGSKAHDIVYDIELDKNNNIILCGNFGAKPESKELRNEKSGSYAILAKIDESGDWRLIKAVRSKGYVEARSVTVDSDDNIFWGLNFTIELILNDNSIISKGESDIIIEKLSSTGVSQWSKHIGGKKNDKINAMSIINGNEILAVGSFEDKVSIDQKDLVSKGCSDFLICQLDDLGNTVWIEQFGGRDDDNGISILSANDGNIIVGGNFQNMVITNLDTLVSSGYYDIAILSYDKDHRLMGTKQLGNENGDLLHSMNINNGFIKLTGSFRGELNQLSKMIYSNGSEDIVVMSFPSSTLIDDEVSDDDQFEEDSNKFTLHPNPSTGKIYISANSSKNIYVDLDITDIKGERVLLFENKYLPYTADLSTLSNGLYFIHIRENGKTFIHKVVIMH